MHKFANKEKNRRKEDFMESVSKQIVVSTIVAILVMGIGFALFSDTITVSGTASTTGSMDIEVSSVSVISNGAGTVSESNNDTTKDNQWNVSSDKNSVILTVNNLLYPGASAKYTITLKNTGTIDAKLSEITSSINASDLNITTENIMKDEVITANGGTKTFTVDVVWDEESQEGFDGEEFNIVYNFSQVNP